MASPSPSLDHPSHPTSIFSRRPSASEHLYAPSNSSPLSPFSISSTPTQTTSTPLPLSLSTKSHYYRPPRSSLTSPTRSNISSPTGSPTRSSRQTRIQSLLASDPLLSHLTPVTIVRFANDAAFGFSSAEREWSIRAADGIVKVGEWLREVEGWNLNWRRASGRRGSNSNGRDMAAGYLPPTDRPKKRRKLAAEESDGDGAMGSIKEVEEEEDLVFGSVRMGKKTRRKLFVDRSMDPSDNEKEVPEFVLLPPVESTSVRPPRKPLTPYQMKMQRQKAAVEGETTPTQKQQKQTPLPTPQQTPVTAKRVAEAPKKGHYDGETSEEEEGEEEEEYWGSLKKSTVEKYEARIAFIKSEIEELDVEALKSKVLSYRTGTTNPLTDSSAIITATTLQLLPPLHRLTKLLSLWTVRLAVLRIVPVFLRWLSIAEAALDAGYAAITHPSISPNHPSNSGTTVWRGLEEETYTLLQETITQKVATAGRLMDTMLDALEGREDVLPDVWISELEDIEERVSAWEMDGERIVLEGRLRLDDLRHNQTRRQDLERERQKTALVLEQERSTREAEMVACEVDEVMERAEETERGLRDAIEANEVVADGIELGDVDGAESPIEDGKGELVERELLMKLENVEKMRMTRAESLCESDTETEGEWVDANEERGRNGRGSHVDATTGGFRRHGISLEPIHTGRGSSVVSTSSTPFLTPMPTPWFAQNGDVQEVQSSRGLRQVGDITPARVNPVIHPTAAKISPEDYPLTAQDFPVVAHDDLAMTPTQSPTQAQPATPRAQPTVAHPEAADSHTSTTQTNPPATQTNQPTTQSRRPITPPPVARPISPRTPSPKAQRERITPPSPEIMKELPFILAAVRSVFQVEKQQEVERELERKSEKVLAAQIKAEEKERQKNEEREIDRLAELEAAKFFEECERVAEAEANVEGEKDWSDGEQKTEIEQGDAGEFDLWAAAEAADRKMKAAAAAAAKVAIEPEYRQHAAATGGSERAAEEAEAALTKERQRAVEEEKEAERQRITAATIKAEQKRRKGEAARFAAAEGKRIEAEAKRLAEEEIEQIKKLEAENLARLKAEVEAEAEYQREVEDGRLTAIETARLAAEVEAGRLRLAEEKAERQRKLEAERLATLETARLAAEAKTKAEAGRLRLVEEAVERQRIAAAAEAERLAALETARLAAETKAKAEAERLRLVEEEVERKRIAAAAAAAAEAERSAALETARLAAEAEAKAEAERLRLIEEEVERKRIAAAEAEAEAERLATLETARLAAEAGRLRLVEEEAERKRIATAAEAERLATLETARLAVEEAKAEAEQQRIAAAAEAERLAALETARLAAEAQAEAEDERLRLAEEEAERQRIAAAAKAERLAALEKARLVAEEAKAEAKRLKLAEEEAERKRIAAAAEAERQRLVGEERAEAERQRLIEEEAERQRKLETERLAVLEAARLKAGAEAAEEARRAEEVARQRREELEQLAAIEAARLTAEEAERQRIVALEAERKAIEEEAQHSAEAERLRVAQEEADAIEAARIATEEEERERERVAGERKAEADRLAALAAAKEAEHQRALAENSRLAAEAEAEAERDISAGLEALRVAKAAEAKRLATLKAVNAASEAEAQRLAALEERRQRYEQHQAEMDAGLAAALAEADRIATEEGHDSNNELGAWTRQRDQEAEERAEQERILVAIAAAEAEEKALEEEELRRRIAAQQAEWDAEDEEERRLVTLIQKEATDSEAEDARREALAADELSRTVAAQEAQWQAEEEEERRIIAEIQRAARAEDARREALAAEELSREVAAQEAQWQAEEEEERRIIAEIQRSARAEEERWAAEEEAERKTIAELQRQAEVNAERQKSLEEEGVRRKIAAQEALWAAEEEEEERQMLAAIQQSAAEAEARGKEEQRLAEDEVERYRLQVEAAKVEEALTFEELDRQRRLAEDERQRLADLALAEQEKQRLAAQEAERLKMEREIEEARIMAELAREETERRRQESLLSVEKHTGSNSEGGSISGDDVTEEYPNASLVGRLLPTKDDEDSEGGGIELSNSQTSQSYVPPPSVEMTPGNSRSPSVQDSSKWCPEPAAASSASAKMTQREVSESSSEFGSEVDFLPDAHHSLQQALNDSTEYELPRAIENSSHLASGVSLIKTPSIHVAPSTPQKTIDHDNLPRTAIWDKSVNSPVFDEVDLFGDGPFPSDMPTDENSYQRSEGYGPDEDSSDFDTAPVATSTPKPTRRPGRLSELDSITEVLTPHSPRNQYFKAPDGSALNDTPSKRGKRQGLMLPDQLPRDNEDSGSSGERSNDHQWAPIPLNMSSARPGSSMSNKSSMSNISTKKRAVPEPKPPIKAQRSQRFIRKAPLDMEKPRSLSSASDRPRPSSSASDYARPGSAASKGVPKVTPRVAPKGVPKGTLGPAMKAIRRPRKDINSDDESVTEEPRWPLSRSHTPDWAPSPPTPSLGAAPKLNVTKKYVRQPSNSASQLTPEKNKQPMTPHNQEGSSAGRHRPPKLEFPQASLDDKVNEILTALASPIRLTASNLQKLTETTNKRQPPLRPFELSTPSGIPGPRSIASNPSITSDATSFSRGGRRHVPASPGGIELYHLHRNDGQAPIKLYIRLVGERGERVMVRVGGGWADLAEYLKEYASHHGSKRRVVSGNGIEIEDLGSTTHHHALHPSRSISSMRSVSPAPGSRSNSPLPSGSRSRPASSAGVNRRAESPMFGRRAESPSLASPPRVAMRGGHNGTLPTKDLPVTPTLTAFQPLTYQKQSGLSPPTGSRPPSRPGSSHSAAGAIRRSASRLSFSESAFDSGEMGSSADLGPPMPLGMAGPTGKKSEISPHDQAWVEGMLGEVRKVSANRRRRLTGGSNNGEERDILPGDTVELQPGIGGQFGGRLGISDMGKQGGTRRVFPKKQG